MINKDIYFASWENPPNFNDYFNCYKSVDDRRYVHRHMEEYTCIKQFEVKNMKDVVNIIDIMYYSSDQDNYDSLHDAILEIKRLKRENEELKEQLKLKMDNVAARNKKYYEKNKEKVECQCGSTVTKPNYKLHLKSNKHMKWAEEHQ